ncbi:MAG: acetyltransferase [Candidatus Electrothrix sp. AX2]|nr:acetyltransferase [Candidatus Electrothrix gigas]
MTYQIRRLNKKFVLWGSAGHAKVLADLIEISNSKVIALFDNNPNVLSCLPGIPLFYGEDGLRDWVNQVENPEKFAAALAIGGSQGKDRKKIATLLSRVRLSLPTLIHNSAILSDSVVLGRATQVLANSVVAADTIIGEVCIINNSATIDHECRIGNGVHVAPGAVLCGCVTIEDYSMIGAGAVVLPRINVGKNVVIGAGAIVTRDIPDGVTVVGNPAKLISE